MQNKQSSSTIYRTLNNTNLLIRYIVLGWCGLNLIGPWQLVQAQEEFIQDDQLDVATAPLPEPEWNLDLTVSPVALNLSTKPGESITTEVKVQNNSIGPEYLQIDLAKFQADETGTRPTLLELEPGDTFADWVSFSEKEFIVNAGEWKKIQVTFAPPADAALGYYLTLIFNRQTTVTPGSRETVITGAPAILMLVDVESPNAKRELQLVEFEADRSFYEYLPVEFTVRVRNTGNIHIIPTGDIFIDRGQQHDIAILSINEGASNILAESERDYQVSWEEGFPVWQVKTADGEIVFDDAGNAVQELKWDFSQANRLRIGKYTAHLLMVYDNGERDVPIEAAVSFWVVPWRMILIGTAIMIFALIGIRSSVRGMYQRVRQQA